MTARSAPVQEAGSGIATGPALLAWAQAELGMAARALDARGGRVHAGIHQARKSIRRTRALLRLASAELGAGAVRVERELRRVNRSLATLRDAHALVLVVERMAAKAGDGGDGVVFRRIQRIVSARRAALARDPVQRARIDQARECIAMLKAALAGLPWNRLDAPRMKAALAAGRERCERLCQRAVRAGRDEEWHRWRRGMRRLSQQLRACAAVGIELPGADFDKSLAEQLGVMQDLSLLIAHCGRDPDLGKPDRQRLRRFARKRLARQRARLLSVVVSPPETSEPAEK